MRRGESSGMIFAGGWSVDVILDPCNEYLDLRRAMLNRLD